MKKIIILISIVSLLLLVVVGCDMQRAQTDAEWYYIELNTINSAVANNVGTSDQDDFYPWYKLVLEHSEGSISVATWAEEKVGIRVVKTAYGEDPEVILEKIGIEWEWIDEQEIDVDMLVPEIEYGELFEIVLEIYLPEEIQIDLESYSSEGDIKITEIMGNVEAETSNGNIEISNLISEAILYVKTSNGDIAVEDVEAEKVELETSNGNIVAKDIKTNLIAKTSNGSVDVDRSTGTLEAFSSGEGDITLTNITIIDFADIEGSDNNIYLELIEVGKGDYVVETSNGNIEVVFPSAIELNLEVIIGNGTVTSNFFDVPEGEDVFTVKYPEDAIDPSPFMVKTSNGDIKLDMAGE